MSNFLSRGPTSLSNSSEYDRPEHPPPFTPIRRYTFSRFCALISAFTCLAAFSVSATAMVLDPPRDVGPRSGGALALGRRGARPLLPVIGERRLDRVLGQHRAVDLDGRQLELVHDVGVLDLPRVLDGLALQPLGGQARRRDGAATAERLELGVLDQAGLGIDLDLELHHVAALRRADEPGAHARGVLREGTHVARVVV